VRLSALAVFAICGLLVMPAPELRSGLDLGALDRSVRPQDDLYLFANGGWLREGHIPSDRVTYGTFVELAERAESDLREIIERLEPRTAVERQLRDLYASAIDEARLEDLGVTPLATQLDRIEAVTGASGIADAAGRLSAIGAGGPFSASMGVDAGHPDHIVVQLSQGGTLLPDRQYYLNMDAPSVAVRAAYVVYLETLFRLTHRRNPGADARDVLQLETDIAAAQQSQVESRTTTADDQVVTLRQMVQQFPGFDWTAWAKPQGIDRANAIVLGQPAFFKTFADLARTRPLATWKAWLAARYITASAPYVCRSIADARFEFFGRTLTGQQTPRVRWKQGVALVNQLMGEGLGRLYVEKYFSRESRDGVERLTENMVSAYREAVSAADWMTPQTRALALRKLSTLHTRIGHPERWRSYGGLEIHRDGLLGNVERAQKFENDYRIGRLFGEHAPEQWTPRSFSRRCSIRMRRMP
jgi:putative endopeptidase